MYPVWIVYQLKCTNRGPVLSSCLFPAIGHILLQCKQLITLFVFGFGFLFMQDLYAMLVIYKLFKLFFLSIIFLF